MACLGFAALCFLLNDPGRLNADSLFSVIAATVPGAANNWHSATLGWVWGLPGPWLGQPAGALLMQAGLFALYAGFLPRTPRTVRGRLTLVLELLLRFVLAGTLGFVGKDAVALATLLIGVQLLRHARHAGWSYARGIALGGVASLFLLVKAPNFLIVVIAVALVLPFFLASRRRYAVAVAAALAIGALAVPLNRTVDRLVFQARDVHPDKQLVIFDLAGISLHTRQNAFAKVSGWPVTALPPLERCFLPYMWDSFAPWAPCSAYSAAYDRFDAALTRRWAMEIALHPLAYAQHRLTFLRYVLQSRDQAGWGSAGHPINDARAPAALAEMRGLMRGLHANRPIGLWRMRPGGAAVAWLEARLFQFPKAGWMGLIVALAVLLAAWIGRREGVRLGAILSASLAVGNVGMLAVFGVADPARYMLPTICLACVALLALLAPASRESPNPAVAPP